MLSNVFSNIDRPAFSKKTEKKQFANRLSAFNIMAIRKSNRVGGCLQLYTELEIINGVSRCCSTPATADIANETDEVCEVHRHRHL